MKYASGEERSWGQVYSGEICPLIQEKKSQLCHSGVNHRDIKQPGGNFIFLSVGNKEGLFPFLFKPIHSYLGESVEEGRDREHVERPMP